MWAIGFVHGQSFLCVGDHFCVWVTVFVQRWLFPCVVVILCMGSWLDVWVIVGIGGVVVAHGVVVLWFNWDDSGMVVLTVFSQCS